MSRYGAWVGVDLDGTLAYYDYWRGIDHIGAPIVPILRYVKGLLREGVKVKIFTARLQEGSDAVKPIEQWCNYYLGQVLEVTDKKDGGMVFLIDDRAVAVEKNTGQFLSAVPLMDVIRKHDDVNNPDHPDYVKR